MNNSANQRIRRESVSCGSCESRPRRAVIRTLSGTWVQKQGENNSVFGRRRSYGGGQDIVLDDQRPLTLLRKSWLSKRNGSISCCPEVLKRLRRKIGSHLAKGQEMGNERKPQRAEDAEDLLKEANLTISALQSKLDVYEDLLYGKSRASEVLLNQLQENVRDRMNSETLWRSQVREQSLEASRLQFQLLSFEGNLTDSHRAWIERINNIVKENSELQATVHKQGRLIRRLSSEKTVWKRECEELHSQEDARERRHYQRSNTVVEVGESAEQEILELAILGSCACRSKNQEPCACAKSACKRHKEVATLQKKVSELDIQKDETQRMMEIYKEAFEEQLERAKTLTKKVVQLEREKENELSLKNSKIHALLRLRAQKDTQSGVINSLVDMVCDRTDALLQQQILTKLLSRRLTELENKYSEKH